MTLAEVSTGGATRSRSSPTFGNLQRIAIRIAHCGAVVFVQLARGVNGLVLNFVEHKFSIASR